MNKIDLAGRVAVITGGAQGIGYAIAERLLDSGAKVVLWDIDEAQLADAKQELGSRGAVDTARAELTDEKSVAAGTAASTSSSTTPASPAATPRRGSSRPRSGAGSSRST